MSDCVVLDGSGIKRLRLLDDMGEPDIIECDGSEYVKERTCHNILSYEGCYNVYTYDCCGAKFRENQNSFGSSFDTDYCPNCGAKVVKHE